jgi:hypothetical protein
MALFEKALDYLVGIVTENEEVKKFPKDFVTASMQWIRSWFLTDDDPVSKAILETPGNEAAKKIVLEQKLPRLLENPDFQQQLEQHLTAYATQLANAKNMIDQSQIEVTGNIHLGDLGTPTEQADTPKNIIRSSTIKAGGDLRIGDDNIQAGGNVHIGDVHYHNNAISAEKPSASTSHAAIIQTIRTLVAAARTNEALPKILDYLETHAPHLLDDATQLSARWETLKRKERSGIISNTEANLERNQVNNALLELATQLKDL